MQLLNTEETISFMYRNYKNEIALRKVEGPITVYWGSTDFHPEEQWIFSAYDVEKKARRDFALKDADFTCGKLYEPREGDTK